MNNEELYLKPDTENIPEPEVLQPEDDILLLTEKKNTRFSDILTTQCILCILLLITLLVLNIVQPKYSEMILTEYSAEASADSPLNQSLMSLVEKISAFLNSAPNDRA